MSSPPTSQSNGHDLEHVVLEADGRRFSARCQGAGPLVLCVHGFPDTCDSFREQLPAFANAGFRAVAPMLRGYEPGSQRSRRVADYHPRQIANDVVAWARTLGGGEPIHLVGHDWGAIVTELAIAVAPELFRSATMIAAPPMHATTPGIREHPNQLRNSWYVLFFQLRGIADIALRARNFAFLEKLWRDWSPGWRWEPSDMHALKRSFSQPGVPWCALAYYRAMLNPFLEDSRASRSLMETPTRVPTLLMTGESDGCMDTRLFDFVDPAHFEGGHRLERIRGAGHFVHRELPDEANRLLIEWIERHQS